MEIRPILSALLRNKTGAVLIALQIALTLAIICNAVFIIHDRIVKMDRVSGFDEGNLFTRYGYPDQAPPPWGPLQFTVTSG